MSEFLLTGKNLGLRKLVPGDASTTYLEWLNDSVVGRYTRRRGKTTTWTEMEEFLASVQNSKDWHFAIILLAGRKHIGNLSINSVDELNKNAELSIMIGDRSEQGKGFAKEAMILATKFAFEELGLHRFWAGSPNPAFNAAIAKLGWTKEGVRREAFYLEGKFVDLVNWSILKSEWEKLEEN